MVSTIASRTQRDRSRPAASRRSAPIRRLAAIGSARVTSVLVGTVHHQGTALPGHVAARIWPDALATLAGQLGSTVVVVGTNGKTTTAALVEHMLRSPGRRPIANRSGANLVQGIATSLVRESDLRGRLRRPGEGAPDGVFEVDELALEQVLPALGPTVIIATNLFRDQLDRYGEADSIVDRWAIALPTAAAGSVLVHCADDPRLSMLAAQSGLPSRTFGLIEPPADRNPPEVGDAVSDPVACRTCGRQLAYRWRSIGHLGDFACPAGHIRRQTPDVTVRPGSWVGPRLSDGRTSGGIELYLEDATGSAIARPALLGLPNAYNVAGAIAAAGAVGRDLVSSADAIGGYAGPYGRLERVEIDGRHLILMLVKNPVSLGETVRLGPLLAPDVILLALNDEPADGRDVSWIWDAPIARLVAGRDVVVAGTRAADLRLRLKYDRDRTAVAPSSITGSDSLPAALKAALKRTPRGGTLLAAATYTAMMGLRVLAQRQGDAQPAPR